MDACEYLIFNAYLSRHSLLLFCICCSVVAYLNEENLLIVVKELKNIFMFGPFGHVEAPAC